MKPTHSILLPEGDSLPPGFLDSTDISPESEEEVSIATNHETDDVSIKKTVNRRTFPVMLCESDEDDDDVDDVIQVPSKVSLEQNGESSPPPVCQILSNGSSQNPILSKETESTQSIDSLKPIQQETIETKSKGSKIIFKTEEDFLEFMMMYKQVISEGDSAITVRDKLKSLCRDLQRQNKMLTIVKSDISTAGQTLRSELSTKFQEEIKDVSFKLDEQKNVSLSQLQENEILRTKLKQLAEKYTLSEQQHEQRNEQLKNGSLELQISDLKVKQNGEKLINEQSQMKVYADQVSHLLTTEKNLRVQLTAYGEKFQQFQDALVKSNEVFETFKQEIEKTRKSMKELKEENTFLKSKTEKSDYTLARLVEERESMKKELEKTKNQKERLESLCRVLQAERKQKQKQNK